MCFTEDAKLGKKCTLLDLSRRPSATETDAQEAAVLSGVTKGSSSPPQSAEDSESCERMEEEGAEKKETPEELPAEESPTKMDVDPPDSPSDEEQSKCKLVSDSNMFSCMLSWATCYIECFFFSL